MYHAGYLLWGRGLPPSLRFGTMFYHLFSLFDGQSLQDAPLKTRSSLRDIPLHLSFLVNYLGFRAGVGFYAGVL